MKIHLPLTLLTSFLCTQVYGSVTYTYYGDTLLTNNDLTDEDGLIPNTETSAGSIDIYMTEGEDEGYEASSSDFVALSGSPQFLTISNEEGDYLAATASSRKEKDYSNQKITSSIYGATATGSNGDIGLNFNNCTIGAKVYGGADGANVASTHIKISGGTTTQYIYGGGYGASTVTGDTKVEISGNGSFSDAGLIYGGAHAEEKGKIATVKGSTLVDISGGTFGTMIFGGGNAYAKVGTRSVVEGDSLVKISGGTFNQRVHGGGRGHDTNAGASSSVNGNSGVEISGGTFNSYVVGGGKDSVVLQNSSVSITGDSLIQGNSGIVFGGGMRTTANSSVNCYVGGNSSVAVSGNAVVNFIYGGGFYSEVKQNSLVQLSGNAKAGYVIGGGSQGVVGGESKVIIEENATITGNVWGGGYGTATAAASSKSTVIELAGGEVKGNVLAGGRRAADAKASSTVTNGTKVVLKGEGTKVGGYISGLGDAGSVTNGNRVLAFDTYTGNATDDGYATVLWTKESNGSTIQQYQNFTHLEVVNSKIDLGAISSSSAGNNTFKTLQMVQSDVKAADLGGINAIQLTGEKGSSLTIDSLGVAVGSTFNISSTTDSELALVLSGDEVAEGESSLTVEGTLNISGANLLLQGNEALVDVSGVVSLTSGATLEAAGSVNVNAGTFNIGLNSVAEFAELNIDGYTSVNFAGTGAGADGVVAAGTLKVNAGATLDFNTPEGNDGAVSLSQGIVVDGGKIDMQGVAGFSFVADSTESAQNGTFVVQNGGKVITATNVQIGDADILVTGTGSKLTVGSTAASSITQIAQGSKVQGADMGEEPGATESPENTIESNIAVTDGGAVEFLSPSTYVGSADGSGTKMNVEMGENASLTFKDLEVYADMDIDFLNGADAVFKAETLSLFNESMLSIDGAGNVQLEDILLSVNSTLLSSGQVSITDELNIQGATLAFIAGAMGDAESAVDVALSLGAGAQITSLENINLSIAFEAAATEGLLTNPEGNADFNILIMDGLNKLSAGDALVQNWQENFNVENLTLSTFGEQGELVELFVEKAELVYDADSGTLSLNGTIAVDNVPEPTTAALSLLSLAALAARRRRK